MPSTVGIVNSSRMRQPLEVSNFWRSSVGNGDNKTVTFSWTNTPTNNDLTGHRINIYNSSDTLIDAIDSSGPSATSLAYTFASASTTYRARLFTKSDGGYSAAASLTPGSNRRLSVTTGAASYSYDNSYWGTEVGFVPTHWTQSQWPGEPFGDYTYHGSKAFDENASTWWTGQSWAYSGGNDWVGFKIGAGATKIKLNWLLNFTPSGYNQANSVTLDQWDGSNFNYMYIAWAGAYGVFGGQYIPCNFEIAASTTGYYRLYYTNLGSNPTAFGTYRVLTSEIYGGYQTWVPSTGTVAATANSITDG